jgi:hypothetical protein
LFSSPLFSSGVVNLFVGAGFANVPQQNNLVAILFDDISVLDTFF